MPTNSQMRDHFGNNVLGNLVVRRGGFDLWAKMAGLLQSKHASRTGWNAEDYVAYHAESQGLTIERRGRVKESFDMKINGILVDVKYAKGAHISGATQWTWRIAKPKHSVEVYALVADSDDAINIALVPADIVPLTCMSVRAGGDKLGRLTNRIDNWGIFQELSCKRSL